tara:strand:- start:310 stop:1290 length:981 start_codon:yes stop_codon:yes gene_type:complete
MKNKLLATIAAFGLVGSAFAIEINDNLSINGFIDGSYQYSDVDLGTTNGPSAAPFQKDQALGVDEVELNFITNVASVDGVINLDSHDGLGGVEVEQAHITYSMESGVSFTLGKYGSALGFEREDPTSLYTFSRAYGGNGIAGAEQLFNLGDVDNNVVEGFTVAYSNDIFSIGASFENALSTDAEDDDLNLEVALAYTGIENVSLGLGYFFDNQADTDDEIDVLNVHASALLGKLLVAVEYSELNRGGNNSDLDGYLFLADYDFTDKLGAALRISSNENAGGWDYEKLTIAPNFAITDSLGAIVEYSDIDENGVDSNLFAVELLYIF